MLAVSTSLWATSAHKQFEDRNPRLTVKSAA